MLIIEPYSVDTAVDILAINVPEDDAYPAWSAAVRYSEGEVVTTGSGESLQIWQARLGSVAPLDAGSGLPALYNEAIDPTGANTVGRDNAGALLPNATEYQHFGELWWRDATDDGYLSNRFRMFDPNPARVTRSANPIEFDIRPQTPWSGIALFNINADVVSIELIDGPEAYSATRTLRYPEILSPTFQNEPQAAFVDIPPVDPAIHPSAFLRARLEATASRWIHVGCVIIGPAIRLGHALYGLETELMDFSRFTRDTFGNITTIQRGYSDKVTYPHVIPSEFIGQARSILVARRATLTAFIGHPDVALTITYGYFIDLDVPIEGHSQTSASVVVESVLYDTPDSGEPLPDRVVFIEPDGTACIESHLGQALDLCLENGQITARATASILDVALGPLDVVTWEMEWINGSSTITPEIDTLATDCEQTLPILRWPPSVPVAHEAGIARIKATITHDDEATTVLEPAIIVVKECETPCDRPRAGWVSSSSLAVVENRDAFCRGDFVRLRASYGDGEIELSGESGFQQTFFVDERTGSTGCWPGDCVTYIRLLGGFGDVTADIYRHLPGLGAEKLATLSRDGYGSGDAEFAVIPGSSKTFVFVVVKAASSFFTTLSASST